MSDLLSCPFCGGNAKVEQIDAQNHIILAELMGFDKRAFIECKNCGLIMMGETVEDVEEKWNSRNERYIQPESLANFTKKEKSLFFKLAKQK